MTLAPGDVAADRHRRTARPRVGAGARSRSRSTASAGSRPRRSRRREGGAREARPRRLRRRDPRGDAGRCAGTTAASPTAASSPRTTSSGCRRSSVGTVVALGLNYADHAKELAFKTPGRAAGLPEGPRRADRPPRRDRAARPTRRSCTTNASSRSSSAGTARHVKRAPTRYDHVAGYTVANDYAIRDYLENWYRPNLRVKNRDGADGARALAGRRRRRRRPAEARAAHDRQRPASRSSGNTRDLVFDIAVPDRIPVAFMTLSPGDVILTGTPEGVVDVQPRRRGRLRDRGHRPAGQHASPTTPNSAGRTPAPRPEGNPHAHRAPDRRPAGRERRDYFETVNPATQELLAEVARGGDAEIDAAVAAAKAAFPAWAAMPAPKRAQLMRRLGDLIAAARAGDRATPRRATPAR